jgi:hypothetical protein
MRRIIYATLAVAMLPGPPSWAQQSSGDAPIRVVLPRGVEATSCRLRYFLVGSFGGYGGFAKATLDASGFEIETVHEGATVERLQVILSCSGYQTETMAFDGLPDVDGRTVQVHPKPLGTVRFRGLVHGLTLQQVEVLHVDVDYTPWWICEFFHLPDCGLGAWTVASVELEADGTFAADLPNFAQDAAIGSFGNHGEFSFRIRDQKTGNWLFELRPTWNGSPLGRVSVASRYPGVLAFDAELRK